MRALCVVLLVVIAAAMPAEASGAPKSPLTPDRITAIPANPAGPGAREFAATTTCRVGTTGGAAFFVDYLQPPNDAYFVRARPAKCGECSAAPGVWVSSVRIALEFRVPCSQPVEVAIVAPGADTVCSPPNQGYLYRSSAPQLLTAATTGIHEFTVPLGGAVALLTDSYLRVTFTADGTGCTAPGTRPRLVTTSACSLCVAWNYYPADTTDLCRIFFPGDPLISAPVDSCISPALTPVEGAPPRALALRVSPNPARASMLFEFSLVAPEEVSLEVRDVAGRHVRSWRALPAGTGPNALRWDGLDEHGRRAPPGLYLVTLRTNTLRETRRVVLER